MINIYSTLVFKVFEFKSQTMGLSWGDYFQISLYRDIRIPAVFIKQTQQKIPISLYNSLF